MKITPAKIPDVLLLDPDVFVDERGFFIEFWHRQRFRENGIDCEFVQDNHSRSVRGTLRGLHYQIGRPQGKLIRVTSGEIFDVAVDIRRSSPTFGQWVGHYLSADNKRLVWLPPGFAHGFYVTAETAEVEYKCSEYYAPAQERRIQWNDPQLAIAWPLRGRPLLSDKDLHQTKPFAEAECFP
jgi:dTDP-4-dehydrorhamnose 3,5-epimerase